jgi:hypothetical protein|tara:strand:- start:1794 stop:4094 length:2301 start_codon:yes stop_codon:yes gene_type:complete
MSLEEAILGKSHFLGRDGFRWWIGQVAPRKDQADQTDEGKGWGNRYKVRIMGYHPFTDDLPNEDLPWAIALLPNTEGSGAGNYFKSTQLQQGDVVFGFFLDGDDAQTPAILGHFARPRHVDDDAEFKEPFTPFSGFTDEIKINPKTIKDEKTGVPDQSGEQNSDSQETNSSATTGQHVDQSGAGTKVIAPDTCTPNSISRMAQAVEEMSRRVEELSLTGMALEAEIDAVADQVETMANGFVGRMMDATYEWMEPQLQSGLDKVYNETFGKVFAQMGNSPQSYAAAHASGVASQVGEVSNIKSAENGLACVANKIVEGMRGTVSDMLKDLLASGLGLAGCVGANFVGSFLNKIVNGIADGMKGPLSGLDNLLDTGLNIADFLKSSAFVLEDFSGFLDCGQTNKDKCPPVKKFEIAGGPLEKGADPFNYVLGQMQGASSGIGGIASGLGGIIDTAQSLSSGNLVSGLADSLTGGLTGKLKSKFGNLVPPGVSKTLGAAGRVSGLIDELSGGGSCTGGKQNCGNPTVQIFGGGGLGAIGQVVMGKFIDNTKGLSTLADSVSRTAGIMGVNLKVPGRNYKSPPAISFADKCGIGHGAHGHAVLNEDGTIGAVVMDSVGEGYPVIEDPPQNVGLTTVFVENPGSGYTPGDLMDESVFVFPTGLPSPTGGGDVQDAPVDPTLVPDPYTKLVPDTQKVQLQNVSDKPIFELVVDPVTGGVNAVRVLNILRFETPPVLKILSSTGQGAVLRPVFGDVPEEAQQELLTVIDCIGN